MTPTGSFSFIATDVDPTDGTSHPATPNAGDTVQLFPQSVASTCSSSLSYEWSLISRPPGSQAALSSATAQNPLLGTDQSGVYQLGLVVRDGVGNGTVPLFYSVTTSGCGTLAPTFGASPGGVAFSATPRANADITLTAPAATDGNSSCPTRFHSTPISYAFTVVAAPIGATTSLSQNGGAIATLRVSQGAAAAGYKVQLVATDAKGRSATLPTPVGCTAPGLTATCAPAINNCGAYAPVTQQFSISQSVSGTGTQPADSLPATATTGTTAAGNQTSSKGFYFGYAVTISALTSDPDFDAAVCSGAFAVTPAQAKSTSWSLVSAPAGSHATIGANTGSSIVFTPDVSGGPYKLAMTTSDSTGNSDVSTIAFSLGCGGNSPSIASSSGSQTPAYAGGFAVGQAVRLDATVTDADTTATSSCTVAEAQPFTYAWSFTQAPPGSMATLLSPNTLNASFVPDVAGVWIDSTFSRLEHVMDRSFEFAPPASRPTLVALTSFLVWADCGFMTRNISPVESIQYVHVPMYFCHSKSDRLTEYTVGTGNNQR